MLVMRTSEDPADSVGELISAEQSLGLCDFAFAMNPLGLYRIEPRALGRQQARHYPHPTFATTVFELAVVGGDPASHLSAFVPGGIVPDHKQGLLAPLPKPVVSLWQHQQRNCVLMALTGLPSTNLSQVSASLGRYSP